MVVMIFLALAASWQFDLGLVSALGVATPLNNWRCGIISISTARRRRPRHRWLDDDYDDDGVLDLRFYSVSRRPTTSILNMSKRTPSREVGSPASSPERDENGMETTKTTTTPVRGRYFDFDSTVRSTTRTGAVDRTMQSTTMTTNEVAPDVMRPFTLLLLSQFVLFVGVGAVIPTIPLYGQSIGLSSASNGIVIGAPALALLLVNRAAGGYADDGGRKRAMMGGMAIIALADLGTAYSSDLASLVAARLGLGLGRGYAEAGERGMLADLASAVPGLRGRALALQQACVALGIAIGAPLGGIVVQEYGPRSAFLCVSAAAVAVLAIYAVLPETRGRDDDDGKGAEAGNVNGDGGELWRRLLMTSSTWRSLALAQSGASFGFACKIAIVPILADDYLGGPAGAGLLLSAAGLAGLVGEALHLCIELCTMNAF
jgi:MFS family permease